MLVLPQNLAPLLRPEPHLDVLGTCDPWVAAGRLARDDPAEAQGAGRGPARPGRRGAVGQLEDRARRARCRSSGTSSTFLPSAIPVWAGSHASLGDLLLKPWLSDTYTPTEPRITYYVNSDDTWHLDLWWRQRDLGAEARIKALELTLECVAVFADVPQYAPRAATFTAMLHKVLDDPELRKLHETATWEVVAKTWREQVCTEQDAQIFSEGRGWTSQLVWSISGLDAAHQVLSNVVSRAQPVDEVIASMALLRRRRRAPGRAGRGGRQRAVRRGQRGVRAAQARLRRRTTGCPTTAAGWPAAW